MNLEMLYKQNFMNSIPTNFKNTTKTFWNCFYEALNNNIRGLDDKTRILSIIANHFSYEVIKNHLNVNFYFIFIIKINNFNNFDIKIYLLIGI